MKRAASADPTAVIVALGGRGGVARNKKGVAAEGFLPSHKQNLRSMGGAEKKKKTLLLARLGGKHRAGKKGRPF